MPSSDLGEAPEDYQKPLDDSVSSGTGRKSETRKKKKSRSQSTASVPPPAALGDDGSEGKESPSRSRTRSVTRQKSLGRKQSLQPAMTGDSEDFRMDRSSRANSLVPSLPPDYDDDDQTLRLNSNLGDEQPLGNKSPPDLPPPSPPPKQCSPTMTAKLHHILLFCLITNLACLLAVIPNRSLGIGKLKPVTAGAWDYCIEEHGDLRCSEYTCDMAGSATASGVFGIIAIIINALALLQQIAEYMRPGQFPQVVRTQCVLYHLLWLGTLISWACWASARTSFNSDCDEAVGNALHLFYGWGFVFLVGMWLFTMILAIILTLKVMGKSPFHL